MTTANTRSPQDIQRRLFHKFEKELKGLGGNALLVNKGEIADSLQLILPSKVRNVVVYKTPHLTQFIAEDSLSGIENLNLYWLPQIKPANFDANEYRRRLLEAEAGIVAADYLLADSGAIVLLGEHHRSQLTTLLPPTLIVIASAQRIVEDIHSLHRVLKDKHGQINSSIHYIAGPSRTADIEKQLILGVHGPKEVYVLVISEEN